MLMAIVMQKHIRHKTINLIYNHLVYNYLNGPSDVLIDSPLLLMTENRFRVITEQLSGDDY
jgi:hypothetical protein